MSSYHRNRIPSLIKGIFLTCSLWLLLLSSICSPTKQRYLFGYCVSAIFLFNLFFPTFFFHFTFFCLVGEGLLVQSNSIVGQFANSKIRQPWKCFQKCVFFKTRGLRHSSIVGRNLKSESAECESWLGCLSVS